MRQDEVYYLSGDHLGSTSLTTDNTGNVVAASRYLPYGQVRWSNGNSVTDFGFTSQRNESAFGLMDYNARYYSPYLGRFASPDTIIPNPANPQSLNRYSYVYNNPLRYTDPTGHQCAENDDPCWQSQWYRAHGYEKKDGKWEYTADFSFAGSEFEDFEKWDPRHTVQDAAKHWREVEGLSVVEVMARTSELAAALAGNDLDLFMEYIIPVLSGHTGDGFEVSLWPFSIQESGQDQTYMYEHLQTDGFASAYADPDLRNNQAHHVWYEVQVAYYTSFDIALAANIWHEFIDWRHRSWWSVDSGF